MNKIKIHEVGLRDGLQIEKETVPTDIKLKWLDGLIKSGIGIIQLGSFVHPEKVPQMADTDAIFIEALKNNNINKPLLSALVLNEKGLERGMACGVEMFCMGVSASKTHSRKNTGMDTDEAAARIINMAKQAQSAGKIVQVSVQSAFGCGFEGVVPWQRVISIVNKFLDSDLKNISLADTAGYATPGQVTKLFNEIFKIDDKISCTCHFHNTYGLGIVNCWAALNAGVECFESALGGMGGCPFTKTTGGNVCTEDLVYLLKRTNLIKEIDLEQLVKLTKEVSGFFKRDLTGFLYKTGNIPLI
ncbi:MAG: hydroxymethylglutaryl-CoA lyase [bacterium]